jgi:hypothetical protein
MLLYNETIAIDKEIEGDWLNWMKNIYVPLMMSTGLFTDSKIFKVLHDNDDSSVSYSVQYFSTTIEHIQQYLDLYAPKIADELRKNFPNKHVIFRTLLEQV